MSMQTQAGLKGLLAGAVLVASMLVGQHPGPPGDATIASAATPARARPAGLGEALLPANPGASHGALSGGVGHWVKAPLAAAFDEATDLRAFVIEAERRPAEGGVFHALRALAECRLRPAADDPLDAPADSAATHRRLQARAAWSDRSARRCAAFVDAELADAEVERLAALGIRDRDPLATSYARWMEAIQQGTVAAISSALVEALRRQDAGLLELVALTGQDYLSAGGPDGAATDESLVRVRHAAWRLLPCELGAGCAATHGPDDDLCERSARCAQERWRSGPRLDPPPAGSEMALVLAELARLKGAVQAADVHAILGPPGRRDPRG